MTLLSLSGSLDMQPLLASNHPLDFAHGDRIEQDTGPNILRRGTPSKSGATPFAPLNGQSTYVNRPLTIKAIDGTVYLGGMRAHLAVTTAGRGSVDIASAFTGQDHTYPVSAQAPGLPLSTSCYLGEWLMLMPEPDMRWGFHAWTGRSHRTLSI